MAWRKSPPELIEAFLTALPNSPRIERRQMFGYPAAFVNGNMFAGLHQDDVLVRLPDGLRETLLSEGGRRWEPTPGRVMKNYLLLPVGVEQAALVRWVEHSFTHAASLPERRRKAPRLREKGRT
ncbi:TfoX/Sxy family protein [Hyphomicrobium sp.]|uniref:TfoX/Sxy family protein n=1 Tax=Hyphomicrobium sp. TaxID=82 RepID=UPI002FE2FB5D